MKAETLVDALADTLLEVMGRNPGDIEAETLVEALAKTLAKDGGRDTCRHTAYAANREKSLANGTC